MKTIASNNWQRKRRAVDCNRHESGPNQRIRPHKMTQLFTIRVFIVCVLCVRRRRFEFNENWIMHTRCGLTFKLFYETNGGDSSGSQQSMLIARRKRKSIKIVLSKCIASEPCRRITNELRRARPLHPCVGLENKLIHRNAASKRHQSFGRCALHSAEIFSWIGDRLAEQIEMSRFLSSIWLSSRWCRTRYSAACEPGEWPMFRIAIRHVLHIFVF